MEVLIHHAPRVGRWGRGDAVWNQQQVYRVFRIRVELRMVTHTQSSGSTHNDKHLLYSEACVYHLCILSHQQEGRLRWTGRIRTGQCSRGGWQNLVTARSRGGEGHRGTIWIQPDVRTNGAVVRGARQIHDSTTGKSDGNMVETLTRTCTATVSTL